MRPVVLALSVVALTLVSATAAAEERPTVTLRQVDVVGNARRPAVVIEVTKTRMFLPARTPTLAGAAAIRAATKKDPF